MRSAYVHVLADALTSVLAIAALLAGRYLGWIWMDPVMGIVGAVVIAVPVFRRIANFDDLDPLRGEPGVSLIMVPAGQPIPANADLVLLPGTKSTIADLSYLREQGWDIDILAHCRRGGRVLGLCGGYQMLGRTISDPDGIEGRPGSTNGLGLLDVETVLGGDKTTAPVEGRHVATGKEVSGYEIHLGETTGEDCARSFVEIGRRRDGACSSNGLVSGTYVHGLFADDRFRHAFLRNLGNTAVTASYAATVDAALDGLATHLEGAVDLDRIMEIAGVQTKIAEADTATDRTKAQAPA